MYWLSIYYLIVADLQFATARHNLINSFGHCPAVYTTDDYTLTQPPAMDTTFDSTVILPSIPSTALTTGNGRIVEVAFAPMKAGRVRLQVWRYVSSTGSSGSRSGTEMFELVSESREIGFSPPNTDPMQAVMINLDDDELYFDMNDHLGIKIIGNNSLSQKVSPHNSCYTALETLTKIARKNNSSVQENIEVGDVVEFETFQVPSYTSWDNTLYWEDACPSFGLEVFLLYQMESFIEQTYAVDISEDNPSTKISRKRSPDSSYFSPSDELWVIRSFSPAPWIRLSISLGDLPRSYDNGVCEHFVEVFHGTGDGSLLDAVPLSEAWCGSFTGRVLQTNNTDLPLLVYFHTNGFSFSSFGGFELEVACTYEDKSELTTEQSYTTSQWTFFQSTTPFTYNSPEDGDTFPYFYIAIPVAVLFVLLLIFFIKKKYKRPIAPKATNVPNATNKTNTPSAHQQQTSGTPAQVSTISEPQPSGSAQQHNIQSSHSNVRKAQFGQNLPHTQQNPHALQGPSSIPNMHASMMNPVSPRTLPPIAQFYPTEPHAQWNYQGMYNPHVNNFPPMYNNGQFNQNAYGHGTQGTIVDTVPQAPPPSYEEAISDSRYTSVDQQHLDSMFTASSSQRY